MYYVLAIGTPDDADPLDQLDREFSETLIWIANQLETTNATAISEDDMMAIWIKLPSRGLILHAPAVVLKRWVYLFPGFLALAIVITERQKRRLEALSQEENLPVSEIIRRALDTYLAWSDKTYGECAMELHPPSRPN